MSILFKDRDSRGNPLARMSVEVWVNREDLVTAAIRVLDGKVLSEAFPVEQALGFAAAELTKRSVEAQLVEDLREHGQRWFLHEFLLSLDRADREDVYRVAAEGAVTRLWPGAAV